MARWDYDLGQYGKKLRESIEEGDSSKESCEVILNRIIDCCNHLQEIISDEDKEWYEFDLEDLIQDCEDTRYYLDEYNEEFNEENTDDVLTTFYDLMDSMRVWVAM